MIRVITLLAVAVALAGCAHRELKAPCKNVAAFSAGRVPCTEPEPINRIALPSTLLEH